MPKGEYRYSSVLCLTSALLGEWVVNATPRPLYLRERDTVPFAEEAVWIPGPVWTGAGYFALTRIRSPDRPARSESLYQLSHPGPNIYYCCNQNIVLIFKCITWQGTKTFFCKYQRFNWIQYPLPPPLDICVHSCGPRASPCKICGTSVGWSWPALLYVIKINPFSEFMDCDRWTFWPGRRHRTANQPVTRPLQCGTGTGAVIFNLFRFA